MDPGQRHSYQATHPVSTLMLANGVESSFDFETNWKLQIKKSLRLHSTLAELVFYQATLDSHLCGSEVLQVFKQNPALPGVIFTAGHHLVGMISRQRFYEHMTSFRYSVDVFWNRPISVMQQFLQTEMLVLTVDTSIEAATREALHRPADRLYEPVVVNVQPGDYRLLDMHQLLLAQAHVHELTVDALRLTEAKHLALLNAIPDAIFRISREGIYLYGQGEPSPYLRVPPTQVLGLTISDVLSPSLVEQTLHYLDQSLQTGEHQVFESEVTSDQQTYTYETRLVISSPNQVLAMVRDVTERKWAEEYRLRLQLQRTGSLYP